MRQLTTPTDANRSPAARRRDSPTLWVAVAIGSLLLHVAAFLGMRWFNIRVSIAQSAVTDAAPIELVDLTGSEANAADPAVILPDRSSASTDAAPIDAVPTVPAPTDATTNAAPPAPQPALDEEAPLPSDPTLINPVPSVTRPNPAPAQTSTSPEADNSVNRSIPTPTPLSTVPPPGNSLPPPDPISPNPVLPDPIDGSSSNPSTEPSIPTESPSLNGSGTATDPPNPPTTNPPFTNGAAGESEVAVSQEIAPARVIATLNVSPVPNAVDLQDQIAQPKINSQELTLDPIGSACLLDAESFNYLGATVALYVQIQTIDADTGRVSNDPTVRQSSGSDAYDRFAACLMRDWEFRPASTEGQQPPYSEVIVQITIAPA